jgi:hypothetical protein
MMVNVIEAGLPPMVLSEDDSSPAGNHRSKGILEKIAEGEGEGKLSYWQLVFLQSRANGCFYDVEDLPHANWQWPTNTWFQVRLSDYLNAL